MSYTICSRFKGEHIVYAGYTICTSREHIVYGAFCGSTRHDKLKPSQANVDLTIIVVWYRRYNLNPSMGAGSTFKDDGRNDRCSGTFSRVWRQRNYVTCLILHNDFSLISKSIPSNFL